MAMRPKPSVGRCRMIAGFLLVLVLCGQAAVVWFGGQATHRETVDRAPTVKDLLWQMRDRNSKPVQLIPRRQTNPLPTPPGR
jgi:hypothetical protein